MDPLSIYLQLLLGQSPQGFPMGLPQEDVAIEVPDMPMSPLGLAPIPPMPMNMPQQPMPQPLPPQPQYMGPEMYGVGQPTPGVQMPTPQIPQMNQNAIDNQQVTPTGMEEYQNYARMQQNPGMPGAGMMLGRLGNNANLAQQRVFQDNFTSDIRRA